MSITIVSATYGNVSVTGALYYLREGDDTIRAAVYEDGCTFTASPSGMYEFVGWYDNEACTTLLSSSRTYKCSSGKVSRTIYPKFKRRQ